MIDGLQDFIMSNNEKILRLTPSMFQVMKVKTRFFGAPNSWSGLSDTVSLNFGLILSLVK